MLSKGQLEAAVQVLAFLGQKCNYRLVYDSSCLDIDHSMIKKCDWKKFYWGAKDAITINAQEPGRKEVDICMFVDTDHA